MAPPPDPARLAARGLSWTRFAAVSAVSIGLAGLGVVTRKDNGDPTDGSWVLWIAAAVLLCVALLLLVTAVDKAAT